MVAFLTVGMLALGTGTAAACVFNFGGGFTGVFGSQSESAAYHQYRPPCLPFFTPAANGQCVFDPLGFIWEFVENTFCWQSNGHGGFVWAKGNGWILTI